MANLLGLLTLVIGVPLNAIVTSMLVRSAVANPKVAVLRERAILAVFVLLNVATFGLIFVNNDTVPPWIGLDTTKLITRTAILALAIVPASWWLSLWARREGEP